jgi:hypothetical protein
MLPFGSNPSVFAGQSSFNGGSNGIQAAGNAPVSVTACSFQGFSNDGILLPLGGSAGIFADHSSFNGGSNGIQLTGNAPVSATACSFQGFSNDGILATGGTAATVNVDSSTFSGGFSSIRAYGGFKLLNSSFANYSASSVVAGFNGSGSSGVYTVDQCSFLGSGGISAGVSYEQPGIALSISHSAFSGNATDIQMKVTYTVGASSGGYNVYGSYGAGWTPAGSDILADAKLQALANNGGSTQTLAIDFTSPALDIIPSGYPPVDQRGVTRPIGFGGDAGAFEAPVQPTKTSTPTPTPSATPTVTPVMQLTCQPYGYDSSIGGGFSSAPLQLSALYLPQALTLTSCSILFNGFSAGGQLRAVVYSGSSAPANLLGQSAAQAAVSQSANVLSFGAGLTVPAGTLWIGFQTNVSTLNTALGSSNTGDQLVGASAAFASGPPASLSGSTFLIVLNHAGAFSVQACGVQGVTPSQTPTPSWTPTATPTASFTQSATLTTTPTATPSASPTVTLTFSSTFTATPSASPSATASVTPDFTATPTSSPTPAYARSGLGRDLLAPVPAHLGQPLCLYFSAAPASSSCSLYNVAGERVLTAAFQAETAQCLDTQKLAPGLYWAKVRVQHQDGSTSEFLQKLALLP